MSLISELFSTVDKGYLGGIAERLGESDQGVSQGLQTSMAATLGGIASQSENPGTLRRILDLVPAGEVSWANAANSIADPNSSLLIAGKQAVYSLFGNSESAVTSAISAHSGLRTGAASTLMALAGPVVISFLSRRVRDEGMSMSGLGNLLHREAPSIRAALPASLTNLFWPREQTVAAARPVVTRAASSSTNWLLPLFLLALIPGLIWLFTRGRSVPPATITVPSVGTANRAIPDITPPIPELPKLPTLSKNVDLYFNTGSSKLRPESKVKLKEFAEILESHPGSHLTLGGYTDNVGNAGRNLKLSQRRANAVMAELTHKGIAADRVTAKGYGEDDPIADNGTAAGRAQNRRVSLGINE